MTLETLRNANIITGKIATQECIISQLHEFMKSDYKDRVFLTTPADSTMRYAIADPYRKDLIAWLITKHEIILKDLKEDLDTLWKGYLIKEDIMRVVISTRSKEEIERCDYRDAYMIEVDGKKVFSVYDDEPEDSNLGRSFSDVYKIDNIIRMAFEAGKRGEELLITNVENDEI